MSTTMTENEIAAITGYIQPGKQLATLKARGFERAYRDRSGRVILERSHYDAVCQGTYRAATVVTGRQAVNTSFIKRAA